MRTRDAVLALVVLVAVAACKTTPAPDPARDEAAIRAADARWLAAAQARDLEGSLSYWSDDAILMVAGAPPMAGKEAIRRYVVGAFAIRDFSISWATDRVWVAKSGDIAYATGTTRISMTTPDGKPFAEHDNAVTVWRKEPDGSWKCVVDIGSPSGAHP
jgi:uncharacterized protein (TIGR02246 family)